jgi:hypothetical protein
LAKKAKLTTDEHTDKNKALCPTKTFKRFLGTFIFDLRPLLSVRTSREVSSIKRSSLKKSRAKFGGKIVLFSGTGGDYAP